MELGETRYGNSGARGFWRVLAHANGGPLIPSAHRIFQGSGLASCPQVPTLKTGSLMFVLLLARVVICN